ncbi:hypothetical protein E2C01_090572 [Portunus trituberculatus]|uniref:Uncharacterized protein n=1 Tax=Portunus trituberculatus TaxID=210409 RepID=A0A5B7JL84_PORTR|nr:hypothetical protein [Portunus trituberculatus]
MNKSDVLLQGLKDKVSIVRRGGREREGACPIVALRGECPTASSHEAVSGRGAVRGSPPAGRTRATL